MKYTLDKIQELGDKIADDIINVSTGKSAEETIVDAAIKAENEGVPGLTLDVMASALQVKYEMSQIKVSGSTS